MSDTLSSINEAETVDSRWKGLYRFGGAGAIIAAALLLIES